MGVLAWITLLPLAGAVLTMLVPRDEEAIHRGIGLGTAIITFLASLFILPDFDAAVSANRRQQACRHHQFPRQPRHIGHNLREGFNRRQAASRSQYRRCH